VVHNLFITLTNTDQMVILKQFFVKTMICKAFWSN